MINTSNIAIAAPGQRIHGFEILALDLIRKRACVNCPCRWCTTMSKKKKNIAALARAHGLSRNIVHQRIKLGWSLQRALTQPLSNRGPRRDPSSIEALARARGLEAETIRHRVRKGMTLEEALKPPPKLSAIVRAHGLNYSTVYNRLKKGMTLEEALKPSPLNIAAMARARGLSYQTVRHRLKRGMTPDEALAAPISGNGYFIKK